MVAGCVKQVAILYNYNCTGICLGRLSIACLKVCSHERQNEFIPVWDFKLMWKQVFHMKFHFDRTSKRPNILMGMYRHFTLGSVYLIFYQPNWHFLSVKMTNMKSIPALSFKHTCALNTTSNKSMLIHFILGKLCSHEKLLLVWNFISVKMTDMKSILF